MAQQKAIIDSQQCDRSPFCPARRVCPVGAINVVNGVPQVTGDCTGCGKCFQVCPGRAVRLVDN